MASPEVRSIEDIDDELRLLAAIRWPPGEYDGPVATREEIDEFVDELLSERQRVARWIDDGGSVCLQGVVRPPWRP